MDKLERQLAAVGVRGQCQVVPNWAASRRWDCGSGDVDHVRHHQFSVPSRYRSTRCGMIIGEATALVVNTDRVQHFAARLNGHSLLTQDANPSAAKSRVMESSVSV
jgi:hypothetical protein